MRKIILSSILVISALFTANAQDENTTSTDASFGIKAGYNSFIARASADGNSASASTSGFYVGVFADIQISEKFNIQPELQYILISDDGENGNILNIPIMAKYKVAEKFSLLAGPQLDYILDDDSEGLKKLGIGLAAGLAVDISNKLFVDMRYSFGLSDRLENAEADFGTSDVKVKFNYLQVGLGYRF